MRYLYSAALGFLLLLFSFAPHVPSAPAYTVTVEPDVEAHRVVGALYALSAAMNLYHNVRRQTGTPDAPTLLRISVLLNSNG